MAVQGKGLQCRPGLPHFARGEIVKGFGRGSKELGIPTANVSLDVVQGLPTDLGAGIYCGFANVNGGEVHKMVMSIGWNPHYGNTIKSMETHIMHKFEGDLYGRELRVVILAFIRGERSFDSLDDLIKAIHNDIDIAQNGLESLEYLKFKNDPYFMI